MRNDGHFQRVGWHFHVAPSTIISNHAAKSIGQNVNTIFIYSLTKSLN